MILLVPYHRGVAIGLDMMRGTRMRNASLRGRPCSARWRGKGADDLAGPRQRAGDACRAGAAVVRAARAAHTRAGRGNSGQAAHAHAAAASQTTLHDACASSGGIASGVANRPR
ncbi:hypothetical protein BST28156_03135 [Burkholderia stagnalis]|nr:hypothetical protein BST28156_03135 [Burkholderia stagnalis]